MAVRANISKGYIWRPGIIGVAALAMSAWFFYDGTVKYPLQQKQWDAYTNVYQQHADPIEAGKQWEKLAKENNWPTTMPTKRAARDIFTQKLLAGITGPVGLYFFVTFLMSLGRWVEADERGVRTKTGKETDYNSITSIDKSRWQSKGIAVVFYTFNGRSGQITLDDWKFDREQIKRILEAIDERMPGNDFTDEQSENINSVIEDEQI